MRKVNKQFLVAVLGVLFAVGGGFLRLNAKALSMHSSSPSALIAPGGKSLGGSITFSWENPARTAALTDIGLVLLYAGAALLIVAVATWLLASHLPFTVVKTVSATEASANTPERPKAEFIPRRRRFRLPWTIWKRANT